jgi:sulfur carrier protein
MPPVTTASPTIVVNGEPRPLAPGTSTIAELVSTLGLAGKRIAVERNGEIVPRSRHDETALAPGDRVEIVAAVGGG